MDQKVYAVYERKIKRKVCQNIFLNVRHSVKISAHVLISTKNKDEKRERFKKLY